MTLAGRALKIAKVDPLFQQRMTFRYPPHQAEEELIERFAAEHFSRHAAEIDVPYTYLPIFWTSWHCNNDYGKKRAELQRYYDKLRSRHREEHFFTVVQYDDNTLIDTPGMIKFCGANFDGIPIPLLVSKHPVRDTPIKWVASFVGRMDTHPVRVKMHDALAGLPGYFISTPLGLDQFRETMCGSLFSLCPRGYGCTSFRIWETLQMGKVPVVIYADGQPWLPFKEYLDWSRIAILADESQIEDIPDMLRAASQPDVYAEYVRNIATAYGQFFSGEGICKNIIRTLRNRRTSESF